MLQHIPSAAALFFEALYFVSLLALSALGLHRYRLCWLYLKARSAPPAADNPPDSLPLVTVLLPVYNEVYVVERLVEAVCAMDYPPARMEIFVLDDSTDRTSSVARRAVDRKTAEGFDIRHMRRFSRRGYKAGALKDVSPLVRGEFIALFDADFVPPADFLRRVLGRFSDPQLGIAQARWGHINLRQSLLTRLQGILLDGHFLVEQVGRSGAGLFLSFNGTASVLRTGCLRSAGGWHDDTVAEDLDLSCRVHLKGWKIVYMPDIVCPAELPSGMEGFKSQQRRWAMGGIQNAKKYLRSILSRKDLSAGFKTEAAFHMLGNLSSPFFLVAVLSALFVSALGGRIPAAAYSAAGAVAFAASGGIFAFYLLAVLDPRSGGAAKRFALVPLTMVLWAGIALSNTAAVARALFARGGEFVRTPKTASAAQSGFAPFLYEPGLGAGTALELALSAALGLFAARAQTGDPFLNTLLVVFSAAFFFVPALSIKQRLERHGLDKSDRLNLV